MLAAGGRASPFGDLAKCATAAGADVSRKVMLAKVGNFAWYIRTPLGVTEFLRLEIDQARL